MRTWEAARRRSWFSFESSSCQSREELVTTCPDWTETTRVVVSWRSSCDASTEKLLPTNSSADGDGVERFRAPHVLPWWQTFHFVARLTSPRVKRFRRAGRNWFLEGWRRVHENRTPEENCSGWFELFCFFSQSWMWLADLRTGPFRKESYCFGLARH